MSFQGKKILLGISGSIAAYLSCDLARRIIKSGGEVQVIMTEGAKEFITPLTLQTLTGRPVIEGLFDPIKQWDVEHIGAAQWADAFAVVPATANVLAKLALGLADDSLSATFLASQKPKVLAPAMNTAMYENPITQENLTKLRKQGCYIVEPQTGLLACGDTGKGKLADPALIAQYLIYALQGDRPLKGLSVLVSAGPTREALDPVRYITNYSSGKMGYALAFQAWLLGAEVTLVSGPVNLSPPPEAKVIAVSSAAEMAEAILANGPKADIIIKAAAVADYTPKTMASQKIKKKADDLVLELARTTDILKTLGERKKTGQILVGFAAETEDLLANAAYKLERKHLDLIAANDLTKEGSGFATATNQLTLLWPGGKSQKLDLMSKDKAAAELLLAAAVIWQEKNKII